MEHRELPWIPPWVVLAAHLAHAGSWGLLAGLWAAGLGPESMEALAWPHLAGLGWLSVVSLGVMCHVVPGFLDVRIPAERFARFMMCVAWLGSLLLAAGFWLQRPDVLLAGGCVAAAGILGAAIPLALAIMRFRPDPSEAPAPLMPAFLAVTVSLAVAAVMGTFLALSLAGHAPLPFPLPDVAAAHAHWAGGGWLTLLVFGVSTRTFRRILGAGPARGHGLASGLLAAGILLLGIGWLFPFPWVSRAGAVVAASGALAYAGESVQRVARATGPHKPVRAFAGAGAVYLGVAVVLGLGTAFGQPWGPAYVFVALAGWVGQTINGHLSHIGIRFLATCARGEADETEPYLLLSPRLSWASFALFQVAVACGTAAALSGVMPWAGAAGACGLAAWTLFSANALVAWRRALRPAAA